MNTAGKTSITRGLVVACAVAVWLVPHAYLGVWMHANDGAYLEG